MREFHFKLRTFHKRRRSIPKYDDNSDMTNFYGMIFKFFSFFFFVNWFFIRAIQSSGHFSRLLLSLFCCIKNRPCVKSCVQNIQTLDAIIIRWTFFPLSLSICWRHTFMPKMICFRYSFTLSLFHAERSKRWRFQRSTHK